MPTHKPKQARLRVSGPDHMGVIGRVTTYLYHNKINIEDIDQRILHGTLVMNMLVDLSSTKLSLEKLKIGLARLGKKIGMTIELKSEKKRGVKNAVLLVTREAHCLKALVRDMEAKKIRARPRLIVANRPDLEKVAERLGIPFYYYPSDNKKKHEAAVTQHLHEVEADVIVLARYMQILSPDFCFRFEGQIINIHPSLLPAFPGATPYSQAYNKGVEVAGVTAHFATTDLDQGPIITQEFFRIDKQKDTIDDLKKKGQRLEAKALCRAVKLFCDDQLVLRRGKVVHSKKEHAVEVKAREWY